MSGTNTTAWAGLGTATGTGPALVLLHRSIGGDSLATLRDELASEFSVHTPPIPGYDGSPCPEWARSPRDLAAILAGALNDPAAERPVLLGLGLGGWVAAEIAAACSERLRVLVLVGPLGVQPRQGEITDPYLVSTERYVELGFARSVDYEKAFESFELGSEEWLRREANREMTTRIAWRPRMFDTTLPFRLPYVTAPTLVIWGEQDAILPRDGAVRYMEAIPGAELATVPDCGHLIDLEAPAKVRALISKFAAAHE